MNNKKILIILILLLVVLFSIIGAGAYYLYTKGIFDQGLKNDKVTEEIKPSEFYKAEINSLVLNITNAKGRLKLMKISFTLKSIEPTIEQLVESNNNEIKDLVISQVSSRTSEELLTVGGKLLVKDDLLDNINRIINNSIDKDNDDIKRDNVTKVLFTVFVMKW